MKWDPGGQFEEEMNGFEGLSHTKLIFRHNDLEVNGRITAFMNVS